MSSIVLELKDVRHSFRQGGEVLEILKGVNLAVRRGEIVALLGPSGSGKTTLLQIAGLLEQAQQGEVWVGGEKVTEACDAVRTRLRGAHIGFVYQFHHLLPDFTALENLMLPQLVLGIDKASASLRARQLLDMVGLGHRINHYPSQLSGGEQQRVAISRGLANKPGLLLADEPTGNLDPATAEHTFKVLVDTIRAQNIGALVVTHDHDLAARMDRVLQLKEGRIV